MPRFFARFASALAAVCALLLAPAALAADGSDANVPGEIMVKLKTGDALAPLLARYPLTLVSRFGARPIFRLKTVGNAAVDPILASLALEPDVMIAEPNTTQHSPEVRANSFWVIGDPSTYVAQWGLDAIKLPQAKNLSMGAGIRVAILDTGLDMRHRLMRETTLLPGRDFVDGDNDPSEVFSSSASYGHGTHVAGLIALAAPRAAIMPLRVVDTNGDSNAWVLAEALLYAIDPDGNPDTDDGAHVINISLGSLNRTRIMNTLAQIAGCQPAVPDDPIGDRSDPGYADDERRCANGSQGAVIVAAAGNEGSTSVKEYPAAEGAYGLIAVGATRSDGLLAGFSNAGPWVELAAPGEGITSAIPGSRWGTWSGTSMAAPLAAGTAALLMAYDRTLTPKDVAVRLKRTATVICGTNTLQVNALAALTDTRTPPGNCPRSSNVQRLKLSGKG